MKAYNEKDRKREREINEEIQKCRERERENPEVKIYNER